MHTVWLGNLFPPAEDDKELWGNIGKIHDLLDSDNADFKRDLINRIIEKIDLETARFIRENCPEIVPPDMKDQLEALIILGILDN